MTRRIKPATGLLVALLAAVSCSSGVDGWMTGSSEHTAESPYPPDLATLVRVSDAIVLGRQESTVYAGYLAAYDTQSGQPIWVEPPATSAAGGGSPPLPALGSVSDMTVRVTQLFLGDAATGDVVTVRVGGNVDEDPACNPSAFTSFRASGDEYLFFLGYEPDGTTYGLPFGNAGRLDLSGEEVVDTACPGRKVLFARSAAPSAFLEELRAAIRADRR